MLVCPSLALMSVPSDQSSPVQTFLSFAGVKQKESLEWPVAAHQNDTSWVFFWGVALLRNTYGIPQHANLIMCVLIQ